MNWVGLCLALSVVIPMYRALARRKSFGIALVRAVEGPVTLVSCCIGLYILKFVAQFCAQLISSVLSDGSFESSQQIFLKLNYWILSAFFGVGPLIALSWTLNEVGKADNRESLKESEPTRNAANH